jgi:hypothetical protein
LCLRILNEQLPDLSFGILNDLLGFFGQRLPADITIPCGWCIHFPALGTLTGFDLRIRRFLGNLQPGMTE